jgi:hypothetical protein
MSDTGTQLEILVGLARVTAERDAIKEERDFLREILKKYLAERAEREAKHE